MPKDINNRKNILLFIGPAILFPFGLLVYYLYSLNLNFSDLINFKTNNKILHSKHTINFTVNGFDVLVFLHIQKTGGTLFESSLTKDGVINGHCKCFRNSKKCNCENSYGLNWLFSRYSTGWKCGLHADWTELKGCINKYLLNEVTKKKLFGLKRITYFITVLRNPYSRFVSEWRHVQRGATWWKSKHMCKGKIPSRIELPLCYDDDDWSDVNINEFMNCPYNLAINRQSRMLADLTIVDCYNFSYPNRDNLILKSAKENLQSMVYFGILEYLTMSQYLFQKSIGVIFKDIMLKNNISHSNLTVLPKNTIKKINYLNDIDWKLYRFAEDLFLKRIISFLIEDKYHIQSICKQCFNELNWKKLSMNDVDYLKSNSVTFEKVMQKLLIYQGSNYPSESKLFKKRLKLKKKFKDENFL